MANLASTYSIGIEAEQLEVQVIDTRKKLLGAEQDTQTEPRSSQLLTIGP